MVDQKLTTFTVIGIGEVGSTVASLINSNFSGISLHLVDIHPSRNGKVLDLQHAGACNRNKISYNDPDSLSSSDIIVFTAGYSNVHGESRNSVSSKNKELVRSVFKDVQLKPDVTIIVITNPVEPVSHWINEATGKRYRVIGTGTALDTFRMKFLLQERFKCDPDQIETLVIGEHGQNMVPLYSSTTVKGIPVRSLISDEEWDKLENELKQSAFLIRETEKATKFGVAETSVFLIKVLLSTEECILPVSIPFTDRDHSELYVSLPVRISLNKVEIAPFEMTDSEKEKFQAAVRSIAGNLE
jgi:malate/lactate dehydrogenase